MAMVTEIFTSPNLNSKHSSNSNSSLESMIIKPIIQDDKTQLISHSKAQIFSHTKTAAFNSTSTEERFIVSRIFHQCCLCDSIECSTALLNGELLGLVPLVNGEFEGGMSPLHAAAEAHAKRVVELLLKKYARTDLKTRDGRGLLALELALCSDRMDVIWNSDKHSIEDLVVCLAEKDLTTVKLLSERTKEFDDVAYVVATKGRVVQLAALLIVAAKKVIESKIVAHEETGYREKTTIYNCLIREALALGRHSSIITAHRPRDEDENAERRKLLLCEIELLQLFGAGFGRSCMDRKVTSPLIVACQEGDEAVVELLLKTDIDVNDVDAGGNSALHWSLKAVKIPFEKQIRLISLLLKHGALVNQKNLMGLTAVHVAASNGISQAVEVLLLNDPKCIYSKTATQETPLFFAVRNDHMGCAELLLRWGAEREVLNLCKNRPIDFARTQDMRSVLNPVNISHLSNRSSPNQHEYDSALQSDEVVLETCKALLKMTRDGSTTERMCLKQKTEVCKYFDSSRGCVRGEMCFYAHDEKELWQIKQETSPNLSPTIKMAQLRNKKIFVGGLPSSVNSDSLRNFFEKEFGSVEDAIVIGNETDNEFKSQRFGFVTFKHKKSVSAAVQARYTTIMGKQVEIKDAVSKSFLDLHKDFLRELEQNQGGQHQPLGLLTGEKTVEMPSVKRKEDVQAHDTTVTIKGAAPKSPSELHKNIPTQLDQNQDGQNQPLGLLSGEKTANMPSVKRKEHLSSLKTSNEKSIIAETSSSKTKDEIKFELKSWVDMLLQGQRKPSSAATQPRNNTSSAGKKLPMWLKKFKCWLPSFLKDASKDSGHYALSSLKLDFKIAFGLQLDHSSLGYSKLSDFMRSFPGLCQMKFVPIGKYGYANHLVLFPCPPQPSKLLRRTVNSCVAPNDNIDNGNPNGSEGHKDHPSASSDICSLINSDSPEKMVTPLGKTNEPDKISSDVPEENSPHDASPNAYFRLGTSVGKTSKLDKLSSDVPEESSPHDASSPNVYSRFLKFLEPDALFYSRPWLSNGRDGGKRGTINERIKFCNQHRHTVLEALVRKWSNSSVFFLRDFDFYDNYKANISQRKCFGCKQRLVQWANYPCQHVLWCTDCKLQFAQAAGSFKHLCVICDVEVQKIELHPLNARNLSLRGYACNDAEFPLLIRRM